MDKIWEWNMSTICLTILKKRVARKWKVKSFGPGYFHKKDDVLKKSEFFWKESRELFT